MQSNAEDLQSQHYDKIVDDYDKHYGDHWSSVYRNEFINQSLTRDLDLRGMLVLEAMCGSGQTTPYLVANGARVIGLDISEKAVERFSEKYPDCTAMCGSILSTNWQSESFDACVVVGGLHHLHPHLEAALNEIHRILKPGGTLCFAEPFKDSVMEVFRALWYRYDPLFEKNEEALDLKALENTFEQKFNLKSKTYGGNIGYLLIFNSFVFRLPHVVKNLIARPILMIERVLDVLLPHQLKCFCVVQWEKRR